MALHFTVGMVTAAGRVFVFIHQVLKGAVLSSTTGTLSITVEYSKGKEAGFTVKSCSGADWLPWLWLSLFELSRDALLQYLCFYHQSSILFTYLFIYFGFFLSSAVSHVGLMKSKLCRHTCCYMHVPSGTNDLTPSFFWNDTT